MKSINNIAANIGKYKKAILGILLTSGGSAIGIAASVIVAPIVARLYTPEQYGIFGVCLTIISFIVQNGMFRFEDSLLLEENEANTKVICQISLAFAGIFIGLSSIALSIFGRKIFASLNIVYSPVFVYFIIGASFITLVNRIMQVQCMRRQWYHKTSLATTASSVLASVNQVGFGFLINGFGLFLADLVSRVIETLILLFNLRKTMGFMKEQSETVAVLIRKYHKFIIFLFPQNLLIFFTLNLPTLAISNMFGQEVNGNYQMANKMVIYPIGFLTGAISSVFFAEGSKLKRENPQELLKLIKATVITLLVFSIPISLVVGIFGEKLSTFIFSAEWDSAGRFCRYMLPMYLTGFWISPLAHIFVILERQEIMLFYHALRIISVIVVWVISQQLHVNVMVYLLFYSSVMAINYLVMLYSIVKTTKKYCRQED